MEQQRARIRTIKAHPVREGCYTRRLTPRGIVQRPGICDIKLFNHRTIEKARVSHVVGDSRQGMCVYTYIRVHSCMCIGSRIARKSRPFRVFPLPPSSSPLTTVYYGGTTNTLIHRYNMLVVADG